MTQISRQDFMEDVDRIIEKEIRNGNLIDANRTNRRMLKYYRGKNSETISKLQRKLEEAKGLLKKVEWMECLCVSPAKCFYCGWEITNGHNPTCKLKKFLKENE